MTKRRIMALLFSVFAVSGVIGASLANAGSPAQAPAIQQDSDNVQFEGTGPGEANEANEANEAPEANEANGAAEAPETGEATGTESDSHEDVGDNADHQCPPDCDTANGETP